jgi:hypothetical protein
MNQPAACLHAQVLPNGTLRSRGLPLSEKLLPGERWQDAVARGVAEELGPVLPRDHRVSDRVVSQHRDTELTGPMHHRHGSGFLVVFEDCAF